MAKKKANGNQKADNSRQNNGVPEETPETKRSRNNTKRRNSNNKKGNRERDERVPKKTCDNDMSWYVPTPELVNDTSNFTFYQRLGDELDIEMSYIKPGTTNWINKKAVHTMPGIMSIGYQPVLTNLYRTIADANKSQNLEGINMAARMLKSRLRLKNTGTSLYDAPDLARYCMACGSAIAVYAWLVRLYGVSRIYAQQNSYFPKKLMEACGCAPGLVDEIINNPTTVRSMINRMALQLNSLVIPKIFPLIDRHIWLNSKILSDGPSVKSQLYVFRPNKYLRWSTSSLVYASDIYDSVSLAALRTNLDVYMNELLGDVSIAIISGDILKTYTGDVYTLGQLTEDIAIGPEFMPEIMDEIQNLDVCPITISDVETTDKGNLFQTYAIQQGVAWSVWNSKLINVQNPVPTSADIMYATRLAITSDTASDKVLACGTEIVNDIKIYVGQGTWTMNGTISATKDTNVAKIDDISRMSQFKYHPLMVQCTEQPDGKSTIASIIGDIENYTTISHEEMLRIQDVAKQGLFGIAYGLVTA